jgi:Ferritin-like
MNTPPSINTRTDLLKLLCEAAELEHGIACSYLYAGFSLKRDISEGGMTWEEQQKVRRWAAQIYFVASQEMLHLALVWNMTTAIGGIPYYFRPNFPQNSKYYPFHAPLELEAFGPGSLKRFILYERPEDLVKEDELRSLLARASDDGEELKFGSIGELYRLIESGFRNIDEKELFIGSKTQQMTKDLVHFPDLVPVVNRASAIRAIEEITEQGEGTKQDRDDSHYGAFVAILKDLLDSQASGSGFTPARPAMKNPSALAETNYGANANPIEDKVAAQVAALFDSSYSLMLRMLAWSFEFDSARNNQQLKDFCATTIDLMPRVLMPLGEGLMLMPAGKKYPGKTAGPGFGLTRHVMLPPHAENARKLCGERFVELADIAVDLLKQELPTPVQSGCRHLQNIAKNYMS